MEMNKSPTEQNQYVTPTFHGNSLPVLSKKEEIIGILIRGTLSINALSVAYLELFIWGKNGFTIT